MSKPITRRPASRGERLTASVSTLAVVAGSLGGLAYKASQGPETPRPSERIMRNEQVLKGRVDILDGTVTLGPSVHIRNEAVINNGNDNDQTASNLIQRPEADKPLVVTRPEKVIVNNKEWIVFDMPAEGEGDASSLENAAERLAYVAVEDIVASDHTAISFKTIDGQSATIGSIPEVGGDLQFSEAGTTLQTDPSNPEQGLGYVMTTQNRQTK